MDTDKSTLASARAHRGERLNMRVSADALALIRGAAAAQSLDVTSFVLGAAIDRARDVMLNEQFLEITIEDIQDVERALDGEPEVIEQLAYQLRRARTNLALARDHG